MVFDSISEEVWISVFRKMRGRNFITEIFMISVFWITTVENAGAVEEFYVLAYFCPETVFEGCFGDFACCRFFMRSRWVRIPMTFGKRCDWRLLRNLKVSCIILKRDFGRRMIHTISNPKEPSTKSNTRSAIFPMPVILLRSLHSTKESFYPADEYCDRSCRFIQSCLV